MLLMLERLLVEFLLVVVEVELDNHLELPWQEELEVVEKVDYLILQGLTQLQTLAVEAVEVVIMLLVVMVALV
tara:strand:+ start:488 stop:706 length:219 start_codon:yes stop_codon:yes gene_type:complete